MQETLVRFLGWEDPLEKGKATDSIFWPGEFHGPYSPWLTVAQTELLSLHFNRDTDIDNKYMDTRGQRRSEMNGEIGIDIYTQLCVK